MHKKRWMRWLKWAASTLVFAAAGQQASATLVTFDELPWNPLPDPWNHFADQPVTDQYASLGLLVDDGYLSGGGAPGGGQQYLLGGPYFSISFIGTLPNYVSFNLSSAMPPMEGYVTAIGNGSFVGSARTGGYFYDGSVEGGLNSEMPYVANKYVSFASATGISSLRFQMAQFTRISVTIDNLYFGAVPAVPEPSALLLFSAGVPLLVIAARRRKKQRCLSHPPCAHWHHGAPPRTSER